MTKSHDFLRQTPDLINRLKETAWFVNWVSLQYHGVAQNFGCALVMSPRRLVQVHGALLNDDREIWITEMSEGNPQIDQLKIASRLCFFLLQLSPVEVIHSSRDSDEPGEWLTEDHLSVAEHDFILYGNEVSSWFIALRIAQHRRFELVAVKSPDDPGGEPRVETTMSKNQLLAYGRLMKKNGLSVLGIELALRALSGDGRISYLFDFG